MSIYKATMTITAGANRCSNCTHGEESNTALRTDKFREKSIICKLHRLPTERGTEHSRNDCCVSHRRKKKAR